MIVLDSCILIALADVANPFHRDAQRILTTTEPLAITALSGAEIMVHPADDQRKRWYNLFRDLAIKVVAITADDMEIIAQIRRDSGLKMPDALVLWLAKTQGASLASFDQRLISAAHQLEVRTIQ